ncbi:MAG: carboxypeptidase M32 [Candidatus Hodarchaeota archaeon]
MQSSDAYKALMKNLEYYYLLEQVIMELGWDMRVMMPPKGISQRSKQLALLRSLQHSELADPKIGKLLNSVSNDKDFNSRPAQEQRNTHLINRLHNRETKIPKDLVGKLEEQRAKTNSVWEKAKQEANYGKFKPEFEKLLELCIERAKALGSGEPFDTLMDLYFEPGMTSAKLKPMFDKLKKGLIPLIERCIDSPRQPDPSVLKRSCPLDIQAKLSEETARLVGFDFEAGRIDETEHPFTSGDLYDVRITTHYYEDSFTSSFFAVLHEAGHGIYQQVINPDFAFQPLGEAASYGVHESQSRFTENIIGRSFEFWKYYLPRFKELTGDVFQDVSLETMYAAVNRVALTPIRIFADELTYALHIILRFELERDLLNEKIDLNDLPGAWNDKVRNYLKIEVENDAMGVLQDVHWSTGYFGYFPSYELGNIYSAQLLASIAKDIPNYKQQITQGNFGGIKAWLDEHVRYHGSLYDPEELIEKATGEKPTANYLLKYLESKYTELYDL